MQIKKFFQPTQKENLLCRDEKTFMVPPYFTVSITDLRTATQLFIDNGDS